MLPEYIPHHKINKQKWDNCIDSSLNCTIYAQSFFLDQMAGEWDALVLNDYETVMPVTFRKKFFIKYLYQPAFAQQLGIFYSREPDGAVYQSFLSALQQRYKFAEIPLNHFNINAPFSNLFKLKTNYILDLHLPYEKLYENYNDGFTKSLRRIKKFDLIYTVSENAEETADLYEQLYSDKLPSFTKRDFANLKAVYIKLNKINKVHTRKVTNKAGDLMATAMLMEHENRLYNIVSCVTKKGKMLEANYFLYDNIIKEFSGKDFILDLEGSDVKGIADFYKKMNPVNYPYPFLKYNNLPGIIKVFKK